MDCKWYRIKVIDGFYDFNDEADWQRDSTRQWLSVDGRVVIRFIDDSQ